MFERTSWENQQSLKRFAGFLITLTFNYKNRVTPPTLCMDVGNYY
jgi:hypothetical protein